MPSFTIIKDLKWVLYVRDEVNGALDRAALKEQRSRSQMAAVLIEEALRAKGYLSDNADSESQS